jgi:hypothetical protein
VKPPLGKDGIDVASIIAGLVGDALADAMDIHRQELPFTALDLLVKIAIKNKYLLLFNAKKSKLFFHIIT